MEQQLIELLLVAKKALSSGQSIGEQANQLSQQSELHADIIERTWPKLVFVHNHILVQLSTLDRIRDFVLTKIEAMRTIIKQREDTLAKVSFDLQSIFGLLRSCEIDPGILELNQQTGQKQDQVVTLFDYIQDQAVLELQQHADEELGKIEMLCSSVETLSKQLSNQINELAAMRDNALSISLDESTANFANAKTHVQETEMTAMADILTGLTNHYDQLGEATRICQANPETCEELDITVLQDDHERLPDILNDLRDSLDIVASVSEEIQVQMQIYTTVQDELLKVLDHFEQFSASGGLADHISEKLIVAENEMNEHESNLDHYFEQLTSLTEWYRQFTYSYHQLIIEVERRRKVDQEQENLRLELMRTLEETYQEEVQERHRWIENHGQYLPQDLCAFIFNPPSKLTVIKEQESKQLPQFSKDTIQKALEDVKQQQIQDQPSQ
ncbi:autophagy-related protein 17 [Halteromyces radiatus]|uniref:autophagy-related protein 17 n=1 Tax=Halteromyces radiatus TaxID=101107 RepID=UPI00221EC4BA|nr:autophagy-related protein 17 [Halteromyces radiatus]KAI8093818.1 autophagy-related protein 17 [Halteromyces radiatus]